LGMRTGPGAPCAQVMARAGHCCSGDPPGVTFHRSRRCQAAMEIRRLQKVGAYRAKKSAFIDGMGALRPGAPALRAAWTSRQIRTRVASRPNQNQDAGRTGGHMCAACLYIAPGVRPAPSTPHAEGAARCAGGKFQHRVVERRSPTPTPQHTNAKPGM